MTLHTLLMEKAPTPGLKGWIEVYDKSENFGKRLAKFEVNNGTFPQSITSLTDTLVIKFTYTGLPRKQAGRPRCDVYLPCIRYLMEATVDDGQ